MRIEAKDVEFYDIMHHTSPWGDVDFEVRSVRETAAGSLVRIDGRALPGQAAEGRVSLSFQPTTMVEVTR
jgi:hypothetical protein